MDRRRSFWIFHLVVLVLGGLFIGFFFLFSRLRAAGFPVLTCPLHDILHVYCPVCGGTRSVLAFLRFDFLTAIRLNPAVLLSIPVLLFYYAKALTVFIRGGLFSYRIPRGWAFVLISLFAVFFFVRNILLIGFGFDPTGDFIHT